MYIKILRLKIRQNTIQRLSTRTASPTITRLEGFKFIGYIALQLLL